MNKLKFNVTMTNPDATSTPSSPDADDGNNSGFPYEFLPDPAKVQILLKIHDPQDKLNILRMLPELTMNELGYDITGWDRTCLQFELVYPLVRKYLQPPYAKDGWKTLTSLCKVSPAFQRIVTSHFEKYITLTGGSGNYYFREYQEGQIWTSGADSLTGILAAVSDKASPSWHTTLPFGIATSLRKGGQVQFLTKLGRKVWSMGLSTMGSYPVPGSINYLVECLRLVPNLRRLALEDFYPPDFNLYDLPPEVLHEEHIVLPELPHLKMISLIKDCNKVQQWILPKYTHQLEAMDFEDCFLNENFTPSCFPKLETIHVKFIPTEQGELLNASIDNVNGLLNRFLLSPLKVITVILDRVDVTKFFNFMLTLNHFGNTLNTLEMTFGHMNTEISNEVKDRLKGWILQLNFPKLTCLHLGYYEGPLEFILQMKALRKLNIVANSVKALKMSQINGLKFSIMQKDMLESSIWQLFPQLDWLQLDYEEYYADATPMDVIDANGRPAKFYAKSGRFAYNIPREMYDRHQRNKKFA